MLASKILPDTCAWIDFLKGRPTPLAEALGEALTRVEVVTCGIVLFELLQGIKNPNEGAMVLNALQSLPHLDMSRDLWIMAGQLAANLRSNGHTLPLSDIIIATLALENECAVMTIDRHFDIIPGLNILKGKTP
ncbi:MAG: PIN domain-containing protein [Deltaproteobacteria bacterium]